MLSTSDEQVIISYIMNALEEEEEAAVSSRLACDESFRRHYRRVLKSLQPILSTRLIEEEETQIRRESNGLVSRTMCFIRNSLEKPLQTVAETVEMMETVADTCSETKVSKSLEPELEFQIH